MNSNLFVFYLRDLNARNRFFDTVLLESVFSPFLKTRIIRSWSSCTSAPIPKFRITRLFRNLSFPPRLGAFFKLFKSSFLSIRFVFEDGHQISRTFHPRAHFGRPCGYDLEIQAVLVNRGFDYSRTRKQGKTANNEGNHSFSLIYAYVGDFGVWESQIFLEFVTPANSEGKLRIERAYRLFVAIGP